MEKHLDPGLPHVARVRPARHLPLVVLLAVGEQGARRVLEEVAAHLLLPVLLQGALVLGPRLLLLPLPLLLLMLLLLLVGGGV